MECRLGVLQAQLDEIAAWWRLASAGTASVEEGKTRVTQLAQMLLGEPSVHSVGRAFLVLLGDVQGSEAQQARGLDLLLDQARERASIALAVAGAARRRLAAAKG